MEQDEADLIKKEMAKCVIIKYITEMLTSLGITSTWVDKILEAQKFKIPCCRNICICTYNNMTHWTIKLRNTLQHEAKLSEYC